MNLCADWLKLFQYVIVFVAMVKINIIQIIEENTKCTVNCMSFAEAQHRVPYHAPVKYTYM